MYTTSFTPFPLSLELLFYCLLYFTYRAVRDQLYIGDYRRSERGGLTRLALVAECIRL